MAEAVHSTGKTLEEVKQMGENALPGLFQVMDSYRITHRQLARKLGIDASTITVWRWTNNRRVFPTVKRLLHLSCLTRLTPNQLLGVDPVSIAEARRAAEAIKPGATQ